MSTKEEAIQRLAAAMAAKIRWPMSNQDVAEACARIAIEQAVVPVWRRGVSCLGKRSGEDCFNHPETSIPWSAVCAEEK